MPAKLKTALKAIGYVAFFLAALVLFTIATLPLDALEDYMVRKASDEYGADLQITELSMWGLSGLEMEGVTITPRPSPEEIAEIRAATEAREAWQKRQADKVAAAAGDEAEGAEGAEAAGDGEAVDPKAAAADARARRAAARRAAVGLAAGEGDGGVAEGEPDTAAPRATAKAAVTAVKEDAPPPVPAGPQPLYIEALRAKVGLLKLMSDLTDGKVFNEAGEAELEAQLLGGTITARVERTVEQLDLDAAFAGLDLSQLTVLRNLLPLPIAGGFDGQIDLEVPLDDAGRMRLASSTGFVTLTMSDAVLGPGRIESDGLRNFGGFFDVPRLRLESFGGKIGFEQRRATFEEFAFRGKDLEGDLTGYVQLANSVERFNPRAYLRFKFSDAFLEREKGIGVLMRTVPEIKRGTGGDGFTGFAVSMRSDPKTRGKRLSWRPTPRNPYGARDATGAPAARQPSTPSVRSGRARRPTATPRIPRPPVTPTRDMKKPTALGNADDDGADDTADDPTDDEGTEAEVPSDDTEGGEGEGEGEE